MKNQRLKKTIAMLLAFMMVIGLIPISSLGVNEGAHANILSINVRTSDGSKNAGTIVSGTAYQVQVSVQSVGTYTISPDVTLYEVRGDTETVIQSAKSTGVLTPDSSAVTLEYSWTPMTYGTCSLKAVAEISDKETIKIAEKSTDIITVKAVTEGEKTNWDSVTAFTSNETYYISSASDLAKFRDLVNAGNNGDGVSFMLTTDIDMSTVCGITAGEGKTELSWVPIGNEFKGNFNGNGKKLTNLYINNTNSKDKSIGLFGLLDNAAIIRNLTIESGFINAAGINVGGIAGDGNCIIMNCINKANVTSTNVRPKVAGIAARISSGVLVNCANFGTISAPNVSSKDKAHIGGLAGNASGTTVANCYNTGEITTTGYLASGIVGYSSNSSIINCYNIGKVSAVQGSTMLGEISNTSNNSFLKLTLFNNYGLSDIPGFGGISVAPTDEQYMAKSENELKALSAILGSAYAEDAKSLNGGYPILEWQNTGIYPEIITKDSISISKADVTDNGSLTVTMSDNLYTAKITKEDFSISVIVDGQAVQGITISDFGCCAKEVLLKYTPLTYRSEKYTADIKISYNGGRSEKTVSYNMSASPYWKDYTKQPDIIKAGDATHPSFEGYYKITNAEELAWFAGLVNGTLKGVTQNAKASGFLANDLYLNDTENWTSWDEKTTGIRIWTPIGSFGKPNNANFISGFKGVFSGNGHAVYGIYTSGTDIAAGMFGRVSEATISDLGVRDSFIYQTTDCNGASSQMASAGGIAGLLHTGCRITNCYNTATVKSESNSYNSSAGGIAGALLSSSFSEEDFSDIEGCCNTGLIVSAGRNNLSYAGGIVGSTSEGAVKNCYNMGAVRGMSKTNDSRVSGICQIDKSGSLHQTSVENCYNIGSLSVLFTEGLGDTNIMTMVSRDKDGNGNSINSYYLSGCVASVYAPYQKDNKAVEKSITEFKNGTVTGLLGNAFVSQTDLNDGYPYLKKLGPVSARELPKLKNGVPSVATIKVDKSVSKNFKIDLKDIYNSNNLTYKVKINNGDFSVMDSSVYSGILTDDKVVLTFTANAGYIDGATYTVTVLSAESDTKRGQLLETYTAARALNTNEYYTENDRWNGKSVYSGGNKGFWGELQSVLSSAEFMLSRVEPDHMYAAKKQAIDDAVAQLIPISQVNATSLYENYQYKKTAFTDASSYTYIDLDKYTEYSASVCKKQLIDAEKLLNSLFDENGAPTKENKIDSQASVDLMAEKVQCNDVLIKKSDVAQALLCWDAIGRMLEYYNPEKLREKDFTSDSWNQFSKAFSDAQKFLSENTMPSERHSLYSDYKQLTTLCDTLFSANAGLKNSASNISFHVRIADNYGIQYPNKALNPKLATFNEMVSMPDGKHSFSDLKDILGITKNSNCLTIVHVNGMLMCNPYNGSSLIDKSLLFRNGDDVVISITEHPLQTLSSQTTDYAHYSQYKNSLALLKIKGNRIIEAEAGEKITVSVTGTPVAVTEYSGEFSPAAGVTLFYGPAAKSDNTVNPSSISSKAVTDKDGKATIGLYAEGWYYVSAMNVIPSTRAGYDKNVSYVDGAYPNLATSDSVLVHIVPSSNPKVIKAQLQSDLDKVYSAYKESFFRPENWELLQKSYSFGTAGISSTENLGDAKNAQECAISTIQNIQQTTISDNTNRLSYFRGYLSQLPDDVSRIDKSAKSEIESLISEYAKFSSYQLTQLTGKEIKRYNAIVDANTKGLPDAVDYSVKFMVDADTVEATETLKSMYNYLRNNPANDDVLTPETGGEQLKRLGAFNETGMSEVTSNAFKRFRLITGVTYSSFFQTRNAENNIFKIPNENWRITHEDFDFSDISDLGCTAGQARVYVGNIPYEIKEYRFNGIDSESAKWSSLTPLEHTTYLGKRQGCVNVRFKDTVCDFVMPFNDVIITAVWGPVVSKDELDSSKESAKQSILSAFESYSISNYSTTSWKVLVQAKDTGLTHTENAKTLQSVNSARRNALSAMAAIKTLSQEKNDPIDGGESGVKLPNFGSTIGKVHIIVENQTFTSASSDGSLPAWQGRLIDGWYDLSKNDSMMTAILKALQLKGCKWSTGSQGVADKWDDYDISYLASIKVPSKVKADGSDFKIDAKGGNLGEFSGERGSGWMGTLNDFFVNEGFSQFKAIDGDLANNDEIHIMFTQNMGADLGGSWGNSDTSLKELSIAGGTLMPAFDGNKTSYGLIISGSGSSIKVTPTAANKNYLVKAFLNNYDNDGAYYRRTEKIPVKAGDILYVGVGEKSWPSMNKQGDEAREYSGSKYTVKVYNSLTEYAKDLISALPEAYKINLNNYSDYSADVVFARSIYGKSGASNIDTAKLVFAEKKIEFYSQIKNVRDLLAAIPSLKNLTTADQSKVKKASDAYMALTEAQQMYITLEDVDKYNAAVEWLKKLGINTSGSISGSKAKPEEVSTEITANITLKDGIVNAEVKKDDIDKIIKLAKEQDTTTIKISAITDKVVAKSTIELPERSISDITNAGLSLIVETSTGAFNIDNSALKSIANGKIGSIEMSAEKLNKDKLSDENKKLVGNHPVFELTIKVGGNKVTDFGKGAITVSLPYILAEGENEKDLTVYYIDENGKAEEMQGVYYEKVTKSIIFKTNHFSTFAIVYDDSARFTDVSEKDWFYLAVRYAVKNGLMCGTSDTKFAPSGNMTRAMLVTTLYRLENQPEAKETNNFADVADGMWYAKAVLWASENKIVSGYGNGLFGTNDIVTREQMAVILYNYAKYKSYDVTITAEEPNYIDKSSISAWANSAMTWAVTEKLISGTTSDKLSPNGKATRAQVATIIMRFCENIVK